MRRSFEDWFWYTVIGLLVLVALVGVVALVLCATDNAGRLK